MSHDMHLRTIDRAVRTGRALLLVCYLLPAMMCLAGAGLTACGMVAILSNEPIVGGLFIIFAYKTAIDFGECAETRARIKAQLYQLHTLRKQFEAIRQ